MISSTSSINTLQILPTPIESNHNNNNNATKSDDDNCTNETAVQGLSKKRSNESNEPSIKKLKTEKNCERFSFMLPWDVKDDSLAIRCPSYISKDEKNAMAILARGPGLRCIDLQNKKMLWIKIGSSDGSFENIERIKCVKDKVLAGTCSGRILVLELKNGEEQAVIDSVKMVLHCSQDDKIYAFDKSVLSVRNLEGKLIHSFAIEDGDWRELCISPDGKFVVFIGMKSALLYNTEQSKSKVLERFCIGNFTIDNHFFVSTAWDSNYLCLDVFDLASLSHIRKTKIKLLNQAPILIPHDQKYTIERGKEFPLLLDKGRLFVGSPQGKILYFDLHINEILTVGRHSDPTDPIQKFDICGDTLLSVSSSTIKLWQWNGSSFKEVQERKEKDILDAALFPEKVMIISKTSWEVIQLNLAKGEEEL